MSFRFADRSFHQIQGLVLIGTSMDSESPKSRELGCWDGPAATSGFVKLGGDPTPQPATFEPGDDYYNFLMDIGYGKNVDAAKKAFWVNTIRNHYRGDEGKKRICMAAINLASRDGLYERLPYVKCPVLWLQVSPCYRDSSFLVARRGLTVIPGHRRRRVQRCKCPGGHQVLHQFSGGQAHSDGEGGPLP